jgi:hypothetical protein
MSVSAVKCDVSYDVTNFADHELLNASRALRATLEQIHDALVVINDTLCTRAVYIQDEAAMVAKVIAK